jgi:membrane protease YdiL (CAAX protease family)
MWLTLGGVGITFVVSQVFDLGWRLPSNETGAFVAGDRAWYLDLVSFIYSDLGGPWREELLYRFLALRAFLLLGVTPGGAVVASAALFAVSHLPLGAAVGPIALASFFSFGLATGALTWWTGRLAPALYAHIAFNLMFTLAG